MPAGRVLLRSLDPTGRDLVDPETTVWFEATD
jgi:hypothetical protein